MVEVSERGIKDDELELDLGLSIGGGGSRRSEESNLNGVDPRDGEIQTVAVERSTLTAVGFSSDPQTKREVQALRRQEAKRKREEKRSRGGEGRSEPQEVGEQQSSPPARKKEKSSEPTTNSNNNSILLSQGSENSVNVNLNLSNGEMERYPVKPVQYPYAAPVQFVPYTNGLAYPCMVPCWAPSCGSGFRPFLANQNLGNNGWCNNSGQNGAGGGGGKVVKTASLSNGSPICSTSTISEHYSTASHEGGGSSDTRSQSSLFNGAIAKEHKAQSDHTATSHPIESKARRNEKSAQPVEPTPKPVLSTEDCPPTITTTTPLKETKMEPPKTHGQYSERTEKTPSMPQMPYVSTTGNGPNGTTIHGFLYRYSKSEISIVCVCHGSTFSPAEFVQHAGGTDVTQPLRHITVIPSAFG